MVLCIVQFCFVQEIRLALIFEEQSISLQKINAKIANISIPGIIMLAMSDPLVLAKIQFANTGA